MSISAPVEAAPLWARVALTFSAALLAGLGSAQAEIIPKKAVIVGQVHAGAPWTTAATEARRDQPARLAVVLVATERIKGRARTVYVADDEVTPLKIGRLSAAIGELLDIVMAAT